jgi:hypothetical protein
VGFGGAKEVRDGMETLWQLYILLLLCRMSVGARPTVPCP